MSPAKPGTIRHSADLEPTPRPTPCDVRAELARKSLRHPELRQAAPYSNRQAQHDWLEREPGPLVLGPAPRSRSPGLWSVLEMPNRGDASRRLRCSWQRRAGPRYEPRWRPWCRSFKVRYARRRRLVRCSEVILVRAVAVSEYGASPALVDVPDPHPGPRQVLIKVHAAGMNPMDVSIANGAWASRFAATFPLILGVDVAGTIEAVGENAARFVVGDEVSPERKWPRCQPAREALLATRTLWRCPGGPAPHSPASDATRGCGSLSNVPAKAAASSGSHSMISPRSRRATESVSARPPQ